MSVQRNSFFALKSPTGYWAEIPPIPQLSLCGGTPFTISTMFWYEHTGSEGIFLEQVDTFTFGTKNGYAYFTTKNLGTFVTSATKEPKLEEDEWNRIDVVYDGKTVKLFVQGLLALETTAAGASYIGSTTRVVIGNMEGYLGEIAIYSKAIADADILCMNYVEELKLEDKELYIDFNAYKPKDEGKHKLALQLIGGCGIVNLMNALKPMPTGFAMPYGTGLPNPGGFATSELTIYTTVYPMQLSTEEFATYENALPDDDDVFIFSNGTASDMQNVSLGLSVSSGKPFFILSKTRYDFDSKVERGEWTQIGVTMKDNNISFFIDGKPAGTVKLTQTFMRTTLPELIIGNQMQNSVANRGFRGYIDSVALFDKAMSAERMKGYADVAPYRFDSDLVAMWAFNEQKPIEIISGTKLVYDEAVKFDYRENTVLDDILPILTFALPNTPTKLDDIDKWATRVTVEAITQTIKSFTGFEPTNGFIDEEHKQLNGTLEKHISEYLMINPSIKNTFESGNMTAEDCASIFGAMVGGAIIGGIVYSFYAWGSTNAVQKAMFLKRFLKYFSIIMKTSKAPIITGGLTGAATAVGRYIDKFPAPDAGTCTSEDYTLKVQNLSFYDQTTKEAGALFALPDFDKEAQLPEWQNGSNGVVSAHVLYHRNIPTDKVPSVTMKFQCTLTCEIPIELTIKASCIDSDTNGALLGAPAAQKIMIPQTGDYSITLPLSEHKLRDAELKAHKVVWQWAAYSSKVGDKLIGKTEHIVHVLSSKPVLPWTTDPNSTNLPVYPVITLCEKITALTSSETDVNRRFASQFVTWSHAGKDIVADEWKTGSTYSRWDSEHYKLTFNVKSLFNKLATGCIAIGNLDCACLSFLLAHLHGFDKICVTEISPLWGSDALFLRNVKRVGATSAEERIMLATYNAIGIAQDNAFPDMWDPFITLPDASENGTMITVNGLSFSEKELAMDIVDKADNKYYRSLLCKAGSTCIVSLMCDFLQVGELPLTTIVPGFIEFADVATGRSKFDKYILAQIVLPPYIVRCHSISYKSIEEMITNALNKAAKGTITLGVLKNAIDALWNAVTINEDNIPRDNFEGNALHLINELYANIQSADKAWIINQANLIVYQLNNILVNLREGKSDWNSCLGKYYDPSEWVYVVEEPAGLGFRHYIVANQDGYPIDEEVHELRGVDVSGTGFYITSDRDTICLNNLFSDLSIKFLYIGIVRFYSIATATVHQHGSLLTSDRRVRVLCSSSNAWDVNTMQRSTNEFTSVYYLKNVGDTSKWCLVGF